MTREEAIGILRNIHDKALFSVRTALETLIPELRESEDERIRKWLYDYFDSIGEKSWLHERYCSRKDILAWLEKQKKQKSIEDVIKNITKNKEATTEFLKSAGIMNDNGELAEMYRSEQKPVTNDVQQECPYKDLTLVKDFFGKYKRKCKLSNEACSSKECEQWNKLQADFKRINETFENGKEVVINHPEAFGLQNPISTKETELNSIAFLEQLGYTCVPPGVKQKPAEWSEEDDNHRKDAILAIQEYRSECIKKYGKDPAWADCVDWLKSVNPQPKQEWSEEDEKMFERLKEILNIADAELCKKLNGEAILIGEAEFNYLKFGIAHCLSWLELRIKSLRPQPHWKPTEEQMAALKNAIPGMYLMDSEPPINHLRQLYNDLKKL